MEAYSLYDLIDDAPKVVNRSNFPEQVFDIIDIDFTMSDHGNLQPMIVVIDSSTDPDPKGFISLPNLDIMLKNKLLIGDTINDKLELISRPVDASPAIIPANCPKCNNVLTVSCNRKLMVRCQYCANFGTSF